MIQVYKARLDAPASHQVRRKKPMPPIGDRIAPPIGAMKS
jgi:hypothetical protein